MNIIITTSGLGKRLGNLTKFTNKSLVRVGNKFTICYPYGNYNSDTLNILSSVKCLIGITTKVGPVFDKGYIALELPRLDANYFPKN